MMKIPQLLSKIQYPPWLDIRSHRRQFRKMDCSPVMEERDLDDEEIVEGKEEDDDDDDENEYKIFTLYLIRHGVST